jgi:hypothetical protein
MKLEGEKERGKNRTQADARQGRHCDEEQDYDIGCGATDMLSDS